MISKWWPPWGDPLLLGFWCDWSLMWTWFETFLKGAIQFETLMRCKTFNEEKTILSGPLKYFFIHSNYFVAILVSLPTGALPPRLTSSTGSRIWKTGGCWWLANSRIAKSISGVVCSPSDTEIRERLRISVSCTKTLLTFNPVLSSALQMNECNRHREDESDRKEKKKSYIITTSSFRHYT